jgi:hypothetical protein
MSSGILVLIGLACADYGEAPMGPGGGNTVVTFSGMVQDTLMARCAKSGCHGAGSSEGGFTMGSVSWSEIRNGAGFHGNVLTAGNANASNLFLKTTGQPPFGSRMPFDGPPFLSLEAQTAIRDWIDQGAPDN